MLEDDTLDIKLLTSPAPPEEEPVTILTPRLVHELFTPLDNALLPMISKVLELAGATIIRHPNPDALDPLSWILRH